VQLIGTNQKIGNRLTQNGFRITVDGLFNRDTVCISDRPRRLFGRKAEMLSCNTINAAFTLSNLAIFTAPIVNQ